MLQAGDVVRVDFGFPRGSVPGFERPAVVITDDAVLEHAPRTLRVISVEQLVDESDHIASVGPATVAQIRSVLADLLGIG